MSQTVKPGYKQTEIGVIPEEWECSRIRDAAARTANSIVGGPFGSDLVSADYVGSGVPVIRGQNMGSATVSGDFVFVSEKKAQTLSSNLARPKDLVFTQRGTLGQVSIVPDDSFGTYLISQSQMKVSLDRSKHDPCFLHQYFTSAHGQNQIITSAIQTGVPHTNLGILRSYHFPAPPLPEQRAIATALSDVDALLAALDRLIAKQRDLKQAAMQQLLTGQTRLPGFTGKWETKRLGEIIEEIGDGATPSTNDASNFGGHINWVVIDDIKDEITSTKATLTERGLNACAATLWKPGTLIVSTGATIGEVGIAMIPVATKQGICGIIFDQNQAATPFLKYWFFKNKSLLLAKAQGSTIKEVRAPTLIQIEITLPPLPEQTAIATVLSDMDQELAALEQRRDKTRALKQGMMQELLTGRTRLI